jgi:hypothetical protein
VLNAARQVGAAIGVAAFGAMVSGVAPAQKMIAANNRMKTIAGTVFEYAASIAAPA